MDAVMSAGANRIDGIEYQSSELRKYTDQPRNEETIAAKEKAVTLAQALGNQVGKTYPLKMSNNGIVISRWEVSLPMLLWNETQRRHRHRLRDNSPLQPRSSSVSICCERMRSNE
jgi:hypothetical protein